MPHSNCLHWITWLLCCETLAPHNANADSIPTRPAWIEQPSTSPCYSANILRAWEEHESCPHTKEFMFFIKALKTNAYTKFNRTRPRKIQPVFNGNTVVSEKHHDLEVAFISMAVFPSWENSEPFENKQARFLVKHLRSLVNICLEQVVYT